MDVQTILEKIRTTSMSRQQEYILAMVAETTNDIYERDYVSEGIFMTSLAMNRSEKGIKRVVSTDILGPSWFTDDERMFSDTLYTGPGSVSLESYKRAIDEKKILSHEQMQSRIFDPSWKITENAAELMTDIGFIRNTPLLNLLNGFEITMDNVFRTSAEMALKESGINKRPSFKIDVAVLEKNQGNVTMSDMALARTRRVVSMFSYSLIGVLRWKQALSQRLADKNMIMFPSAPLNAPYDILINMITARTVKFLQGTDIDSYTVGENGRHYIIPSVATVLVSFVAAAEDGKVPLVSGSFYDAILGYDIVSNLSMLVSAEFEQVLIKAPPQKNITNELEKKRQASRTTWQVEAEDIVARKFPGIDLLTIIKNNSGKRVLSTTGIDAFHREIERDRKIYGADITPVADSVIRVCSPTIRQACFSNFSVMRIRSGNSAARFSLHVSWNMLFLASGGVTSAVAAGDQGVRSRLMLDFFLKDLHALFNCMKCEVGFITKIIDTFSIAENEDGERELRKVLGAAMWSLSDKLPVEGTTVGTLMTQIISYGLKKPTDPTSGKKRQEMADERVRELGRTNPAAFISESSHYVNVSKGFAALAFYCLYFSAASVPVELGLPAALDDELDREVVRLLSRWGGTMKFPTATSRTSSSALLLSYVAVWAFRNAVRARRNVSNDVNEQWSVYMRGVGELPGRPMNLVETSMPVISIERLLDNEYLNNADMWRTAFTEMGKESVVWLSSSLILGESEIRTGYMHRAELRIEPSGKIPTTSAEQVTTVLFPKVTKMEVETTHTSHPLSVIGKISLTMDDLRGLSKEALSKMPYFPITPLDRL